MATSQAPSRKPPDRISPILFMIILALIVGFIAAFLILRPAGGGTRHTPTTAPPTTQPSQR